MKINKKTNQTSFLDIINDKLDRKYPLIYKFVKIKDKPSYLDNRRTFYVNAYDAHVECENFFKPVSRCF
jgi:hypothetical protein